MEPTIQSTLRALPSVDAILQLLDQYIETEGIPRTLVADSAREVLAQLRAELLAGELAPECVLDEIETRVKRHAQRRWACSLPRAINATGILLHTGLGRAPLSPMVKDFVMESLEGYSLLAFSTKTGQRRERHFHTDELLAQLTGAEAGLIVNNNAAATLLVLSTFSKDKEAVVSRGELVEIGGSFRMPDVMFQSGAIMHEVGTTNKTHLRDYEEAINENTGLLVKVHKSNYKVVGFSSEPSLEEMAALGKRYDVPVYHDLGSGALIDFSRYGLFHEPTVQESVAAGAHVVTFSGDKLIGGPQSGLIVGQRDYIDRIKKNPLMRAIRCGKLTYAAVEATLKLFLDEQYAVQHNTTVRRLTEPMDVLKKRAQSLLKKAKPLAPASATLALAEDITFVGGGSMPEEPVPTFVVKIQDTQEAPEDLALRLRQCSPSVFTRVQDACTIIDFRTLGQNEIPFVLQALRCVWEATT